MTSRSPNPAAPPSNENPRRFGKIRPIHFRDHTGTTRMPSQAWVAQQLRNATPLGVAPKFLIRDRHSKFGTAFDALAVATGIRVIRTAVRAPNMNAICERFLGSLRRECLDHILVLDDRHLHRVVAEYIRYFNATRALTRGSASRRRCPPCARQRATSSHSQCSAGFIMTTEESRETQYFGPIGEVASTGKRSSTTASSPPERARDRREALVGPPAVPCRLLGALDMAHERYRRRQALAILRARLTDKLETLVVRRLQMPA